MLTFTLELVNLLLLFKWVLEYQFREKRSCLAAGVLLPALYYVAFLLLSQEWMIKLNLLFLLIPILASILIFKGKWIILLGISVCMKLVFQLLQSLCLGINIVIVKGNVGGISLVFTYAMGQIVCLISLGILAYIFREKKDRIHFHVEKLKPLIFVPFILCGFLLEYNPWYFGAVSEELAEITQGKNLMKSGFLGIFLIVTFILAYIMVSQRREMKRLLILNDKCIQEQTEQYRLMGQRDQDLKRFRHDYNDHVVVLHDLAKSGSIDVLKAYINQLGEVKEAFHLISTNNIICDAIVNRYDRLCNSEGMELLVEGKFPDHISISETTLCVLVSNGMKNAYEAVQKCSGNNKIYFDIRNHGDYLFILIKNPVAGPLEIIDNGITTTKADKENHGYGTQNMLDAAMQNGGDVTWNMNDEGFIVTEIMLHMEK